MRDLANRRRWAGRLLLPALFTLLAGAPAAVPAQDAAALTQQLLITRAAQVYAARLNDHVLDADASFTARVSAIAATLIARARRDYPDTAGWAWEVHTTNDPDQNADCMAGGKILVSLAYVQRLELGDAELAMLLAHEIEHAALHHNLQEYQQALKLAPRWAERPFLELEHAVDYDNDLIGQLAPTNYAQEVEADREGMLLAWRAGWPAAQLAGYFRKMYRGSAQPRLIKPDYPSPQLRWQAARELAATLQKNYVQAPTEPLH
ncbi:MULTISPECIES: M48 family metalloprotease [unclassified Duganella]|uniref:M48 family metalloprotease n=1 Tax=unclassified Duganella TaxID=2636909 RepID=UPI001314DF8A|nr:MULTISPECIES: M48 family metalloprotease [unclassified Duganella]